jgi:hypothetical protein
MKDNTRDVKESLTSAYCQSKFKNKSELSKHIDRIHAGLGLLEQNICNNSQNLRCTLMASIFGLLLLFVAILPTISIYVVQNASGQGEEAIEQNNIKLARQVIEALIQEM